MELTDVVAVRRRKVAATQRLLGDTITISEADWRAPIALPGWTRAHVATHLARNADAIRGLLESLGSDRPWTPPSAVQKSRDLEAGARRSPLDLQIELDTSAGRLNVAFDALSEAQWTATTPDGTPVSDLPLARLNEIVLHHIDLDCGFGFGDIDAVMAGWLLDWNARRLGPRRFGRTAVELVTDSGRRVVAGEPDTPPSVTVTGSDAALLGWLTGRLDRTAVDGAEHLSLGLPL